MRRRLVWGERGRDMEREIECVRWCEGGDVMERKGEGDRLREMWREGGTVREGGRRGGERDVCREKTGPFSRLCLCRLTPPSSRHLTFS